MRVLMSLAFAALATIGLSGCQSALVSSSCDTGCGTEIAPGCDGGCATGIAATGSCGCRSTGCDGGCGGSCNGSCGSGGLLGQFAGRPAANGMIAGDCADGSCGVGGGTGVAHAGGLLGGLFSRHASTAGYDSVGCGVGGCGVGGHMCGRCRALAALRLKNRAAANHPYGGMSPHTPPMTGPYGPSAPHYGYPYYTTRGPRDFFEANPSSLGR